MSIASEKNAPLDDPRTIVIMRAALNASAGIYITGTSAIVAAAGRVFTGRSGKTSVKCSSSGGSNAIAIASPQ